MKQLIFSGGLLASDVLFQTSEFVSRPESPDVRMGLFVLGLTGLLLSLLRFGRASRVALIEHGEKFEI